MDLDHFISVVFQSCEVTLLGVMLVVKEGEGTTDLVGVMAVLGSTMMGSVCGLETRHDMAVAFLVIVL